MRGLLAQLECRQKDRNRAAESPDAYDCVGYTAWADIPEKNPGQSSFEVGKGKGCRIVWVLSDRYEETADAFDDFIPVPHAVAKAFGKKRAFRSVDELHATIDALSTDAAFDRIASFCSARERSASDIKKRLLGEGFSSDVVSSALERAISCSVVSDGRFAESYVATKLRSGWGRARIERGLAESGVDPYLCLEDYPEAYFDTDNEAERARSLLAKRALPAKNPVEKFTRFLAGRGFELSTALRVAREEVDARVADELL